MRQAADHPTEAKGKARAKAMADLARLADGMLITQLLHVASELGLAPLLADGPKTADELAAAAGADPDRLARILRGLVTEGVLDEGTGGTFALTDVGLVLSSLQGTIGLRAGLYHQAVTGLLDAVRGGDIPFDQAYGQPFFAHLEAHPDDADAFHAGMAGRAELEAADVVAAYDFSGAGHVVDVGGGTGCLLARVLAAAPDATGELMDRPAVLPVARQTLDAAGVGHRASCAEADFFTAVPSGGDLYLLSRVLHDWDDDDARRILKQCRRAIGPRAKLVVVDVVLADRAADNPAAVRMDLYMLVLLGARERTEAELRQLLADTGFGLRRRIDTGSPTGIAVLEAVPV
jgi:SAM-dependent methyltransferase